MLQKLSNNVLFWTLVSSVILLPMFLSIIGANYYDSLPSSGFQKHFCLSPSENVTFLITEKKELPGIAFAESLVFKTDKVMLEKITERYEEVFYRTPTFLHCFENNNDFLSAKKARYFKFKPVTEEEDFDAVVESKNIVYDEQNNQVFFCWFKDEW